MPTRLLMLGLGCLLLLQPAAAQEPLQAAPNSPWQGSWIVAKGDTQRRKGLHHALYLDAQGRFLMAARWPGKEYSRAAGKWSYDGRFLHLAGAVRVETNRGSWRVPFRRTFRPRARQEDAANAWALHPVPQKNRYGMLGWPQAFVREGALPSAIATAAFQPDLPPKPLTTAKLRRLIRRWEAPQKHAP